MTRALPPLGARALRRALASLEALAAPVAELCASTRTLEVVADSAASLHAGPRLDGLVELLATHAVAEAAPAPVRPGRTDGAPQIRGARPGRSAAPLREAPARRSRPAVEAPGEPCRLLPTSPDARDARAAMRTAWPSSPPLARAPAALPPSAPSVRRPLPAPSAAPLAQLATHVPIADVARSQPVAPVPTPVARPGRAAPPPAVVAPRAHVEAPPPPPPPRSRERLAIEPPVPAVPTTIAPAPRGLAGLAGWWSDRQASPPTPGPAPAAATASSPAVASGLVEPVAAAPGRALGLGALSPSQRTDLGGRSEREASSLAAISHLDDVARALERVLARELRRHGVTPEES